MTAHNRFRIAAAIGALVAPLALVAAVSAPADAGTKHKHDVYMYKVERNIRLVGVGSDNSADSGSQTLSCNAGDLVLDGMWSVKHVDQYNPPAPDPDDPDDPDFPTTTTLGGQYNDERDVWVQASYPEPSDLRSWQFVLQNKAYGDAQVKLFLTCIRGYTEYTNSHHHQVKVRNLFAGAGYYADGPRNDIDGHGSYKRFGTDLSLWGAPACSSPYEYFVAPGFQFGSAGYRPIASYPRASGRSWAWEFATDGSSALPGSIRVYGRCIERRVFDGATPRHAIAMTAQPGWDFANWYSGSVALGNPKELQYSCGQSDHSLHAYKAMVAWFYLDSYWWDNWFLGMEPRPKTRSFYFWNHAGSPASVRYGTLCINSRTSNPLV
ncbi:MAG TPA: hypothetical protein VFT70_08485 [Nocardioides sp.]|nr:hypothetical protein [Nocardioides sp.]